jgi:uncharacterized protein (DUF2252 family)
LWCNARVDERELAMSESDGNSGMVEPGTVVEEPPAPRRSRARVVPHFTVAERVARGKAARAEVPRSVHGEWEPDSTRRDPVDLLEEQAQSRVPELVPIRYGRMLTSPFAFYRGGAYLMASDLAGTPRTGLHTQLCGDAHLSNFGAYASPDRSLVFSLNDFDETLPGPFEWDVKRLAASFAVAGRELGFEAADRRRVVLAAAREYRVQIASFASMTNLETWYSRIDLAQIQAKWAPRVGAKARARFEANVAKTRSKDSLRAFGKLTQVVDGERRIIADPPLLVPIEEFVPDSRIHDIEEAARSIIRSYRRTLPRDRRKLLERYRYVHAARKVVGVGSVGTRAWIMLLVGRDDDDPLFLQFKEAQRSVLEPFLGKSEFPQHGQRVVEGQRLMQSASDILLGWERVAGFDGVVRDFYIRQLWDAKGSALVELMGPPQLEVYAEICGWTLARAHARSGDAVAIASYLGKGDTFDRAIADFSELYADQNERDYKALKDAAAAGRVEVTSGL